jgi:hypothetical protein
VVNQSKGQVSRLHNGQSMRRTEISSLATYVPPRLLTNADLEKMVDTTSEWII